MKTAILCGKLFNSADASISEHALVLIENGKITDVRTGTAAPEGYETVDLSGLFVMSQLTRKAIVQSFIKLLNEMPLDKITVKDIVDDCGVNRGTFYYYYQDVYALLEEIFATETQVSLTAMWPQARLK